MIVTFTKTDAGCETRCTRLDGSCASWCSPGSGSVPHDLVHWVVEDHFHLSASFYGNIAAGQDHYSVNELADPDSELAQTESLVLNIECEFGVRQGRLHADPATLRGMYGLSFPDFLTSDDLNQILSKLDRLESAWAEMSIGERLEYQFHTSESHGA